MINQKFDLAGDFSEGLAAVRIGDSTTGKWGFIDKQGKIIITPQFDAVGKFSQGLAPVRVGNATNGKWGFISRQGHDR